MSGFLVTLLLVFSFIFNLTIAKASSSAKTSILGESSKVVYDVTPIVQFALYSNNEDWGVTTLTNISRGGNVSVHYQIDGDKLDDLPSLPKRIKKLMPLNSKGKFLLFISIRNMSNLDISKVQKLAPKLSGMKGLILGSFNDDVCSKNISLMESEMELLKKALKAREIFLGFGYNNDDSCPQLKPLLEAADFAAVKVDFKTRGLPESYGIFRDRLKTILKVDSNLTSKVETGNDILFHLKLEKMEMEGLHAENQAYNLLLEQFAGQWAAETRSNVIFEMSHESVFETLGGKVTAIEKEISGRSWTMIPILNNEEIIQNFSYCIPQALEMVSSTFRKILVSQEMWETINSSWSASNSLSNLTKTLFVTVEVSDNAEGLNQLSRKIQRILSVRENFENKNIRLDSLLIQQTFSGKRATRNKKIPVNEANQIFGNIHSGCLLKVGDFGNIPEPSELVTLTQKNCSFIIDHAKIFTWQVNLNLEEAAKENFSFDYYSKTVQSGLNKLLTASQEFRDVKRGAKVSLKIGTATPRWLAKLGESVLRNFYCEEKLLKTNEYFEAIGNWARMHKDYNFPVILKDTFDGNIDNIKPAWWSHVQPGDGISEQVGKRVNLFVMRNSPKIASWEVNSCVDWSENIPQEGIQLDKDLSGVSVSMNLRNDSLSEKELQNMLMFALHKFKTVELLLRDKGGQLKDFQTFNSLITTTDFLEALVDFDILQGRLYMEVSVGGDDFPNILKEVEKLARAISQGPKDGVQFAGLHLSDWERTLSPHAVVKEVVMLGKKYHFKVGLTLRNCSELLNTFAETENTTNLPISDYIICPTKIFPAHNENKMDMARSLDTHLYIIEAFHKFLPNLSVFYRLNSFLCCEEDEETEEDITRNLFRFLNDVNQFAVGNRIKYFLVQAFTMTSGSFSSSSWFHVESYVNFSDPSVIYEREEGIRNITSWRPYPSLRKRRQLDYVVILGSCAIFGVAALVLLGAIFILTRRN